jgi:erythromycin esterase-like protein
MWANWETLLAEWLRGIMIAYKKDEVGFYGLDVQPLGVF